MTLSADKAQRARAIEAARRITLRYVSSKLEDKAEDAIRQVIEAEIGAAFEAGRRESDELRESATEIVKEWNGTRIAWRLTEFVRQVEIALAGDKRG